MREQPVWNPKVPKASPLSMPFYMTPYLPAGTVRVMSDHILIGEGTDLEALVFRANLTDADRKFLAALHIGAK